MTFPAYPEYKDSGVEWLGEVPVHWRLIKPKHLIFSDTGGNETKSNVFQEKQDNLYPAFSASGQDVWMAEWLYDAEALVLSAVGARCGKTFLAHGKWNVVANTQVLFPSKSADIKFLWYLTNNQDWWEVGGAAQPYVLTTYTLSRDWVFPPQAEQAQIARFLDHETARIDALIEEQQRLIELLKEKRQAVISHAVTKGLDPDVPMKDSGVEWLGEVPAHWVVGPLRWYATVQGGIAKGKSYESSVETVERPYLRVANVQDGFVDLTEVHNIEVAITEAERYALRAGDVLMNEGGDNDKLGRGTIWRGEIEGCLHQNHVFSIRPNHHLSSEWLAMFTRSDSARAYFYLYSKQSTNLASVSSSNVMSCPLPIPPRREQEEIIEQVNTKVRGINSLMDAAASAMDLLGERRSALISAAVTGKIDVREWQGPKTGEADPAFEPESAGA